MIEVSICVATYNGYPYLTQQVKSIQSQLGPDDQLIISDNGSTDGTLAYLQSIQDSRLLVLSLAHPRGPVPNFENALAHATRPIVVLADQDDVWLPNRLKLIRGAFNEDQKRILCLVTEGERIDSEGHVLEASNLRVLGFRPGMVRNIIKNSYMGCCMAFSRELLKHALPIPSAVPMHDSWLGLLAECFGEVRVISEPSYQYRIHGKNLSLQSNKSLFNKIMQRFWLSVLLVGRIFKIRLGLHSGGLRPVEKLRSRKCP